MALKAAFAEAGFEPIPGYVLRERLGAGGFGEVWLADAPGGLKKAIKLVFGDIEGDRAAGEMRALQRIRQVNHPFVLSLERIEVIDGQLIIVTELAGGSLLDLLRETQQRGQAGITREKLLHYLGDAADALDYLCQKHDLQHLDVKPANLLLVADRIKVADFGLIKDIQNTHQSMMGGLTPVYASPEMFDGRPGRASDQYALAIAYQELLTGKLPFQGRTTAQLAAEHLNKAPNLDPLPISDRSIIGKALQKKPALRYPSCRAMIDALVAADRRPLLDLNPAWSDGSQQREYRPSKPWQNDNSIIASSIPRRSARSDSIVGPQDSNARSSVCQEPSSNRTHLQTQHARMSNASDGVRILRPSKLIQPHDRAALNMFIGIGQTGVRALMRQRDQLASQKLPGHTLENSIWLGIDSDAESLNAARQNISGQCFNNDELIHIPLQSPHEYKQRAKEDFQPISRRWLYNIPRSRKTEGVRALGMLAFMDASKKCYEKIAQTVYARLKELAQRDNLSNIQGGPNIYIVGSAHGGTGGSVVSECSFLVRRIQLELQEHFKTAAPGNVTVVLTVAKHSDLTALELPAAAAVATMVELAHHVQTSGLHPGLPTLTPYPLSSPPIDEVYLIDGGRLGSISDWHLAVNQTADFLSIDAYTEIGDCRRAEMTKANAEKYNLADHCTPWLRTFCSAEINIVNDQRPDHLSKQWLLETLARWLNAIESARLALANSIDNPPSDSSSKLVNAPKFNTSIELFCDDFFRNAGWNAQAWAMQCFKTILPERKGVSDLTVESNTRSDGESTAMKRSERFINAQIEEALNQLLETVQLPIAQLRGMSQNLIEAALANFDVELKTHWLNHYQNWAFLSPLLLCVRKRLMRQAESLAIVSERFNDRINNFSIASAQNGVTENSRTEGEAILKIQYVMHRLASVLLHRLSEEIAVRFRNWTPRMQCKQQEWIGYATSLGLKLNMPVDANGRIRKGFSPLPKQLSSIAKPVQRALDQKLMTELLDQWSGLISDSQAPQIESDCKPQSEDFQTENREQSSTLERLLASVLETVEKEFVATGLSPNDDNATAQPRLNSQSLIELIQDINPPLATGGSGKRVTIMLTDDYVIEADDQSWIEQIEDRAIVLRSSLITRPTIVMSGEELLLEELSANLWPPTAQRSELANRLFSRIDIDWPTIR